MRTPSPSSFVVAWCTALLAAGCAHESKPTVSAATLTSGYVAAASPAGSPARVSNDSASVPALGPDDPTSYRAPASFIADAPRAPAPTAIGPISRWSERYPDAARLLAEWSQRHGAAAYALGQWTQRRPDQMSTLVDWATTNGEDPLGAFFFDRSTFRDLQRIADDDRTAVDELLQWIRRAPRAAEELAAHPGGLAFTALHEAQLARAHASLAASATP